MESSRGSAPVSVDVVDSKDDFVSDSLIAPEVVVQFLNNFQSEYSRNNRGNGVKNLQCFPRCHNGGHRDRAFCGESVTLQMLHRGGSLGNLHAFGEFRLVNDSQSLCDEHGDIFPSALQNKLISDLQSSVLTEECSIYPGTITEEATSIGKIEFKPVGWPYSWVSHKTKVGVFDSFDRVYISSLPHRSILCTASASILLLNPLSPR